MKNLCTNLHKILSMVKIILTKYNETKFAQIDDEEIRFFVRKLGTPEFHYLLLRTIYYKKFLPFWTI